MVRTLLVGLALVPGCFAEQSYACEDAQQCVVADAQGACEPTGFCSFPAGDCPSGRRYSPFAGDGLARTCVEATSGTTDGTEEGTATTDATTESTGCATSCPGGAWAWTLRDDSLGPASGHGIALVEDRLLVTGALDIDATTSQAFVASYVAATGERQSSHTLASDGSAIAVGSAIAAGIAPAYVVAGSEVTDAGLRAFVARFDAADEPTWMHRFDTLVDDEYRGVGLADDGRFIVAGRSGTAAIVHAFDADGVAVYTRTITPMAPASAVGARAIAVSAGGTAWIAGARTTGRQTSDVWARRLHPDGGAALEFVHDDPASTPDVGRAIAALADGGFVVGGSVANEGWLARVAAEASQSARVLEDGEVHGLAIAPDGSIVAIGWITGAGRDVWLAGFTADLDAQPQWEAVLDHEQLDDEGLAVTVGADGTVYVAGVASDAEGRALWLGARLT